ncbi:MAG: toll/interleukin-1 receptor domain-containing protein [Pseudomonadota bacterium]|nr:toll/interleukin-1 receptor domain-containing protein [Pseudomonadota bacterium]
MYDVFFSYPHRHASEAMAIAEALRARSLEVWVDQSEIDDFASISRSIIEGLMRAKALLAYYAAHYGDSRPCQWELTAALLAASREGDPRRRVLVINPEVTADHIHPVELRDALFQAVPAPDDREAIDRLAASVHAHLATLTGSLGAIEPLTSVPWYGSRRVGYSRFVGRLPELWRIHSALQASEVSMISGTTGSLAQVQGMGGVGKSLVVEEYAVRFAAAYPGGVFWLRAFGNDDAKAGLSAEDRDSEQSQQIRDFAIGLGLPVQGRSPQEIAGHLGRELGERGKPFLWVVDDIPSGLDRDLLLRWLAPHPLGKTLLTTRSRQYEALGVLVYLGVLAAGEAYDLLTKAPERRQPSGETEEAAARAILDRLGCHALAVDVAGAALRLQSFGDFLAALDDPTRDELDLARDLTGMLPTGHEPGIAATLLQSLAHLGPEGWDVLRLAAVLAVAPLPAALVQAVFSTIDDLNADAGRRRALQAMHQAQQLYLAEQYEFEPPAVSVHTLVARTVRFHDPEPERRIAFRAAAIAVLTRELAAAVKDFSGKSALALLIHHARELVGTVDDLAGADLIEWVASYDYAQGAYSAAEVQWRRLSKLRAHLLGPMHAETLTATNNLAETRRAQGDLSGARALHERVLASYRQSLGNDHPHTLTAMNNLAVTQRAQGDLPAARDLLEQVLEVSRRVLGVAHSDSLTVMNNLADTLREQGDAPAARALFEQILNVSPQVLGETHPTALLSTANLALVFHAQGDMPRARALQERVLASYRKLLGDEHPDTMRAMCNLAFTLAAQGDLLAARTFEEQALEGYRRLLGDAHPDTLAAMNNLAGTLRAQGDVPGARALLERVLDVSRQVLGERHPNTSSSAWNVVVTLLQVQDAAAARVVFERDLRWLLDPVSESLGASQQAIRTEILALTQPAAGWRAILKRWLRRWSLN